jgi:hypothetical protein
MKSLFSRGLWDPKNSPGFANRLAFFYSSISVAVEYDPGPTCLSVFNLKFIPDIESLPGNTLIWCVASSLNLGDEELKEIN